MRQSVNCHHGPLVSIWRFRRGMPCRICNDPQHRFLSKGSRSVELVSICHGAACNTG